MADTQNYDDAGIGAIFDLSFQRFITLSVIKVLFLLGLAFIALGWLTAVVGAFAQGGFGIGLLGLILVTIVALIYVIWLRITLEMIVVIFRIGENTSKLAAGQGQVGTGTTPGAGMGM